VRYIEYSVLDSSSLKDLFTVIPQTIELFASTHFYIILNDQTATAVTFSPLYKYQNKDNFVYIFSIGKGMIF